MMINRPINLARPLISSINKSTKLRIINKFSRCSINYDKSLNQDKVYELSFPVVEQSNQDQLTNKISVISWEDSNLNPNSKSIDREYIETIRPDLPATFNLATYANHLDIIGHLVKLNVKVYKLEQNRDLAKFILTLDFDRDVKPYLRFLYECGLQREDFGDFLTDNFKILQEELENLEKRLEYYKRMKFTKKEIKSMIKKYPNMLNYPVDYVDDRLGYIQRSLRIKPKFIRQMMINYPQLLSVNKMAFDVSFYH